MFTRNGSRVTLAALSAILLVASQAMAFEAPVDDSTGTTTKSATKASGKHHQGGFRAARLGRLLGSLDLSDAQRTAIRASVAQVRQENQAKLADARPSADVRSQIHDLRTQLRAARQSGDTAKVKELRGQLDPLTAPMRTAMSTARQQVHDAIVAQLTPEQVTKFEAKWSKGAGERVKHRGRGDGAGAAGRMGAFHSLNLSEEQKSQIKQIKQDFRASMQNGDAGTDRKAARVELRNKIRAVLTDDQRAQLDAMKAAKGKHAHHSDATKPADATPMN